MCMLPTLLSKTWISTVKGLPLKNDKYKCKYEKNYGFLHICANNYLKETSLLN